MQNSEKFSSFIKPITWFKGELKSVKPINNKIHPPMKQIKKKKEKTSFQSTQKPSERKRFAQLSMLNEISQHLTTILDQPVAAQLVVNTIQHSFDCDLVSILTYDFEYKEFVTLAMAGNGKYFPPPAYKQRADLGLFGQAARLRRTQVISDTRLDKDHFQLENQSFRSEIVTPLIQNNNIQGILVADDCNPNTFNTEDIYAFEIVAKLLVNAWERSIYHLRLTDLFQAGISISTLQDPQEAIDRIASITKQTLEAQFVFVTILNQEGGFTRTAASGNAPRLLRSLQKDLEANPLIQTTLNTDRILRLRDVRKSNLNTIFKIDQAALRSLLAFPIRLHRINIGVIFAFGKQGGSFFSDRDESLSNLIASQAAGAIESTWLYQELRSSLHTATMLYQLSIRITQAEDIAQAAKVIADTAFNLGRASNAGIILYSLDGKVETQVEVKENGAINEIVPPQSIIEQTIETSQTITFSDKQDTSHIFLPLKTSRRTYGVLWLNIPRTRWHNSRYTSDLQTLSNQATIALERFILIKETNQQANQLEAAYRELETSYDQTLAVLISALDARDSEVEGHSLRVGKIARQLGEELGLTPQQLKALERGALLHDIGKIGISDAILNKPGPLNNDEWEIMRMHPNIGAHIVESVPFLKETMPVIQHHQERWDGSGYPHCLTGSEIPLLARIFAVADSYDALISNRPYRNSIPNGDVIKYLRAQAGILFDPSIVTAFEHLASEGHLNDL